MFDKGVFFLILKIYFALVLIISSKFSLKLIRFIKSLEIINFSSFNNFKFSISWFISIWCIPIVFNKNFSFIKFCSKSFFLYFTLGSFISLICFWYWKISSSKDLILSSAIFVSFFIRLDKLSIRWLFLVIEFSVDLLFEAFIYLFSSSSCFSILSINIFISFFINKFCTFSFIFFYF